MSRKSDNEGLSLWYRIRYRIRYIGMHLYGPAQLSEFEDPHARMRRERAAKVAAARARREAREMRETGEGRQGRGPDTDRSS